VGGASRSLLSRRVSRYRYHHGYADPMVEKIFLVRFLHAVSGRDLLLLCEDDGAGIPERETEGIFREAYKRPARAVSGRGDSRDHGGDDPGGGGL